MFYQKPPFSEVLPLHLRKRRSKYQPPSSEVLHFRGHHFRGFTVHRPWINKVVQANIKFHFVCYGLFQCTMKNQKQMIFFTRQATVFQRLVSTPSQRQLEPGLFTRSKNFKTPFFGRYFKFLPVSDLNWSKTSPKFFFPKNFEN